MSPITSSQSRISGYSNSGRNPAWLFATLLVLAVLQAPSCHDSSNPINPNPEPDPGPNPTSIGILPLKVGYYWKYNQYSLTDSGTIEGPATPTSFKISQFSVDPASVNGDTLFHWVYVDAHTGQADEIEWFFRNYEDGLYLLGGSSPSDTAYTRVQYLKYPIAKEYEWNVPHFTFNLMNQKFEIADSENYRCTDTRASFETPLGTFYCTVYNHREEQDEDVLERLDIYEYYAEGIGKVGEVTYGYFESSPERYPKSKTFLVATNVKTTP
jgi:hypothetical protein